MPEHRAFLALVVLAKIFKRIVDIEQCHTLQASQARVVLDALRPCCPSEIRRRFQTGEELEALDGGVGFAGPRIGTFDVDEGLASFQEPYIAENG